LDEWHACCCKAETDSDVIIMAREHIMRESKSIALAATVIALCLLLVAGNIQTAKAENALSVEGEWEIISTNIDALKNHVGQRQSIMRIPTQSAT